MKHLYSNDSSVFDDELLKRSVIMKEVRILPILL